MSSNLWITWVETIKRQTGCVRLVGHRSACGRRLSLRPIGPTQAQSVTWTAPLQLLYAVWALYKCYMPLSLPSVLINFSAIDSCVFPKSVLHFRHRWTSSRSRFHLWVRSTPCPHSHSMDIECGPAVKKDTWTQLRLECVAFSVGWCWSCVHFIRRRYIAVVWLCRYQGGSTPAAARRYRSAGEFHCRHHHAVRHRWLHGARLLHETDRGRSLQKSEHCSKKRVLHIFSH